MIKPNTIINGDSLKVIKDLGSGSVDLILADPPQNKTWIKWDREIPNLEKLWSEYNRVIKTHGAILIFGSEPFSSYLRMANMEFYRYDLIWDKMSTTNFANAKRMPLSNYELISVFYRKQPTYIPLFVDADPKKVRPRNSPLLNRSDSNLLYSGITKLYSKDYDERKRYPTKIIRVSSKDKECNSHHRQHPAQKPISLCERLIAMYTKKGDIVLDPYMGVGSVCVAANILKRKFIGIEKDRKFFSLAYKKLKVVKGMQVLR